MPLYLDKFPIEVMKKRPHLVKKKFPFHHDNAPANSFAIAMIKMFELHYKPSSTLFSMFDHFGTSFSLQCKHEEITSNRINDYFAEFEKSYFLESLKDIGKPLEKWC